MSRFDNIEQREISRIIGRSQSKDTRAVDGVDGSDFTSNMPTGIVYGGVLSIASGTTFNLTAGVGHIHSANGSLTKPVEPSLRVVSWPAMTGVTATYVTTAEVTYLCIDSTGALIQSTTPFTTSDYYDKIVIGRLVHTGMTTIQVAMTVPVVAHSVDRQHDIFARSFGPLKLSGYDISAGGLLRLDRAAGVSFALGRNYTVDPNNPSVVTDISQTDCTLVYYYPDGSGFEIGTGVADVDPNQRQNGAGGLTAITPSKWSIQRVFYVSRLVPALQVYYGAAEYGSKQIAIDNIPLEVFTEDITTKDNATFLGYMVVKEGATDLTNTAQFQFVSGGLMRNTVGGGGSSSQVLDDLADTIITSPVQDHVLQYRSGSWVNAVISDNSIYLDSLYNPTAVQIFKDDFITASTESGENGVGWTLTNSTLTATSGSANHPGVCRLRAPNNPAVGAMHAGNANSTTTMTLEQLNDSYWVIADVQVDGTDCTRMFGFPSTFSTQYPTAGVYVKKNILTDVYEAVVCTGGVETRATLWSTNDTAWHKVRIRRLTASSYEFTHNSDTPVVMSSGTPVSSTVVGVGFTQFQAGAAVKSTDIDFVSVKYQSLNR